MDKINCCFCGKSFLKKKSQIKRSKNNYCSRSCQYKARRKGKKVKCLNCKKVVYKSNKNILKSKSKKYFCSSLCANSFLGRKQRGASHPNWTGGLSSYREILTREKLKRECVLCSQDDKRILSVHHVDKNRKNNKTNNLVWLCRNCHFLVHHYKNELESLLKIIKVV